MSTNRTKKLILAVGAFAIALFAFAEPGAAQTRDKVAAAKSDAFKATAAYAEVILRRTEMMAELEVLLVEYTDEYPKVKDLRFEIGLLQKEIERLAAVPAADHARLTSALGRLMVQKCSAAGISADLERTLKDEHPDLKRAKRRVEIFETAIKEILQAK